MKRMRVYLSMILLALFSGAYSQQEARQSLYFFNPLPVNPGYAGSQAALSVTGIVRSQWVGFMPIISLPSITAGVAPYTTKTVMLRNGAGHNPRPYHRILSINIKPY